MRSTRFSLCVPFFRSAVVVVGVIAATVVAPRASMVHAAEGAESPASTTAPDRLPLKKGEVKFELTKSEAKVPERFRLEPHSFTYEEEPQREVSKRIGISMVRFPSPLKTDVEPNNTVHCEYYYPRREGKAPAVIVLHILGGDFPLARLFANSLAQHGVAALFLKMPYYGERRDPMSPRRMISKNPRETVEGMTQAILDIRRATAFLASREEVDPNQLGIFGISLGGITGGLAATSEPRLNNICLLLAGGDIGKIAWESPEVVKVRQAWLDGGGSKEEFLTLLRDIDPARYGENVRGRRILMLNATKDEIIPKACTESLWESFGKPEIVWYPGTHYTVAVHILSALDRSAKFFTNKEDAAGR